MTVNEHITDVCRKFNIDGELVNIKLLTDGHINSTYRVEFEDGCQRKKYLVQNVNINVFKNPDILMSNIVGVTEYLRKKIKETGGDPERETLNFHKAQNGLYYLTEGENCWRIYDYVDKTYTYNIIDSNEVFENAGQSFGKFQCLLDGYPSDKLGETIPDFHNTPKRIETLEKAIDDDVVGLVSDVKDEIDFILKRKEKAASAVKMLEKGEIPLRVTHNDTKINNILFDEETNKGVCIIDLDTIMPGLSLYDFGDAIRSGASTALEDETDLSKVSVSLSLYESYVKGYLKSCADALCEKEVRNLAYGAWLMTYECAVRFLTDHIQGDVYFRIDHPGHNLERARNQLKMALDIENKLDKMNEITMKIYNEVIGK